MSPKINLLESVPPLKPVIEDVINILPISILFIVFGKNTCFSIKRYNTKISERFGSDITLRENKAGPDIDIEKPIPLVDLSLQCH